MVALLHLHRNLFELLLVIEVDVLGTALVHSSEFDCRIFAQESNLDNMTIRTIRSVLYVRYCTVYECILDYI